MAVSVSGGGLRNRWSRSSLFRSGEGRVGEEWRSRWVPDHLKKKNKTSVMADALSRAETLQNLYTDVGQYVLVPTMKVAVVGLVQAFARYVGLGRGVVTGLALVR